MLFYGMLIMILTLSRGEVICFPSPSVKTSPLGNEFIVKTHRKHTLISWLLITDCQRSSHLGLPKLPQNLHCIIGGSCTNIQCCVRVDTLNKTFETSIDIDPCAHQITVSIEKYVFSKHLFNYTWGEPEHIWLYGVVRMRYV